MKLGDWIPAKGVWMFPFWFGAFIFGLMLLASGSLPEPVQRWTLPSLAIYLVGVGLVIFLKALHHKRYSYRVDDGGILPTGAILLYVILQVLLFGLLLWYNIWREVL